MFLTEFWERFSYYGMRALLILFMTASVERGGLGFDVVKAGAIYGIYVAMAYLVMLPGGWIADRLIGQRKAVLYGGLVIACGHYALAIPRTQTFYFGLGLIVLGTGLLKPNVSTMVGQLYGQNDIRRDAGFSIFYMGINLGALVAPLVCSYVGEKINWHYGFGLAGVGMTLGVIQYYAGWKHLAHVGAPPGDNLRAFRQLQVSLGLGFLLALLAGGLVLTGVSKVTATGLSKSLGLMLVIIVVVTFTWLFRMKGWTPVERKRLLAVLIFFFASALFWSLFEQAGSTLNLFAELNTNRSMFGGFPTGWFQSEEPLFRHPSGAAIRLALGELGPMGAVNRIEVRRGPPLRRAFLPDSGSDCRADQQQPLVAHLELFPHYHWRTLLKPGGAQRDDEACSGKSRRPDDGFLVPFRCCGKLHWWYSCFLLSLFPLVAAVWNGSVDGDLRWPRDVPVGSFSEKIDGWGEVSSGGSQMMMADSNHSLKRREQPNRVFPMVPICLAVLGALSAWPGFANAQLSPQLTEMLHRVFVAKEFDAKSFGSARWLEEGESYTTVEGSAKIQGAKDIVKYDTATGARELMVPASVLIPPGAKVPLVIDDYSWSKDMKRLLIFTNTRRVWRQNTRGDYWVLDLATNKLQKLGGNAPPSTLLFAKFSPDGSKVAYVRDQNIYVEDLARGSIVPLTQNGSPTLANGTTDWVYEEEFFIRDGFRWSPDGQSIAYWQIDSSEEGNFPADL